MISFFRVGRFAVSEFHIVAVQFNDDGSALVHAGESNFSTSDADEVEKLRRLVDLDERRYRPTPASAPGYTVTIVPPSPDSQAPSDSGITAQATAQPTTTKTE